MAMNTVTVWHTVTLKTTIYRTATSTLPATTPTASSTRENSGSTTGKALLSSPTAWGVSALLMVMAVSFGIYFVYRRNGHKRAQTFWECFPWFWAWCKLHLLGRSSSPKEGVPEEMGASGQFVELGDVDMARP